MTYDGWWSGCVEEVALLTVLLTENCDVFTLLLLRLGQANHAPHEIDLQGHWPVKCHLCQVLLKEMVDQTTEISKMLEAGEVRLMKGPWVLLVVLVTKKEGLTRFCIDYWARNCMM
jgi:hypothetical protein